MLIFNIRLSNSMFNISIFQGLTKNQKAWFEIIFIKTLVFYDTARTFYS